MNVVLTAASASPNGAKSDASPIRRSGTPSWSPVVMLRSQMFRTPDTPALLDKWVPRIGADGARWFAVAIWARVLMLPFGLLLFGAIAVAAVVGSPIGTVLVVATSIIAFSNATLIATAPFMARRAAGKALGIKVTIRNYPPNEEDAYRAWCQRNGVRPNPVVQG